MNRVALAMVTLLLAACAVRSPAPVVDRTSGQPPKPAEVPVEPPKPVEKPIPTYTVKRGDTLVGIALQFGLDYRELAAWNNITNPNVLSVGQVLVVAAPAGAKPLEGGTTTALGTTPLLGPGAPIEARPLANTPTTKVEPRGEKVPYTDRAMAKLDATPGAATSAPPDVATTTIQPAPVETQIKPAEPEKPAGTDREDVDWMWPVKGGKVIASFSEASKGVDLSGKKGAPVVAAASGRVVYAGAGLRGYGKLVIIKHNNTWLSAYAHNDNIVVKEQQDVRKGQKIAEMGQSDTDQVKLHFEVRREGKPVDPAKILPAM